MTIRPSHTEQRAHAGQGMHLCVTCPAFELNFCRSMSEAGRDRPNGSAALLQPSLHTVPARRIICREQDLHDVVPVICQGWAVSAIALSDGRRQILSVLLPGDIVSTALLFEPAAYCLVEAVTEVQYRSFKRVDLKAILFKHPDLFEKLSKAWINEKVQSDQLAVDLGRRTAEERIARMILSLMERLAKRGMVEGQTFEFPLRQHHIADATGLTPVHVSKVLSEFRRGNLIEITDRSVTIRDPDRFRRIAAMR